MGLFSSIGNAIGGLVGGGGTKVNQQAANNTTVDVGVDIQNVIDMSGIQKVMEWLGLKQVEFQDKQLELTEQGTMTIQQLLTSMQETEKKEAEQTQQVIDNVLLWVNRIGLAVVLVLGVWIWRKWK